MVTRSLPRTATGKLQRRLVTRCRSVSVTDPDEGEIWTMTPVPSGPPIGHRQSQPRERRCSRFEPLDAAEVESRLAQAASTATIWAATPVGDRSRLLITVAELLEGELPDIAHVLTTEMGKPFAQAKGEVAKCASAFRWFAEHADAFIADEEVPVEAALGLIRYQPLGRGAGHHALELPAVAGGPVRRSRQSWPATSGS